jgi:hypothetical protein
VFLCSRVLDEMHFAHFTVFCPPGLSSFSSFELRPTLSSSQPQLRDPFHTRSDRDQPNTFVFPHLTSSLNTLTPTRAKSIIDHPPNRAIFHRLTRVGLACSPHLSTSYFHLIEHPESNPTNRPPGLRSCHPTKRTSKRSKFTTPPEGIKKRKETLRTLNSRGWPERASSLTQTKKTRLPNDENRRRHPEFSNTFNCAIAPRESSNV